MRCKIVALLGIGTMTLAAANVAIADGVIVDPLIKNGFYVGVDAGAADLLDKESHTVSPESHQLSDIGPVLGMYIGYDYGLTELYRMAVEGFVEANWLETKIQHSPNTYKMNQTYNLGIRLLPEYVFTPSTMGHVILGYANGRFEIKDNGVYGLINTSYHSGAFQTGIGFATVLQNNFSVRLDALYNFYGSETKQGAGLSGPGSTQFYTNRFSQLAGEVSVYYKFA